MAILNEEQYIAALKTHDWEYEASDDFQVWKRGRKERKELLAARETIDKGWIIWNEYAPIDHKSGNWINNFL